MLSNRARTIRPTPALVRSTALAVAGGLTSLIFPRWTLPTLAYFAGLVAVALSDILISLRDPAPRLERSLPERLAKACPTIISYEITRAGGPATPVSVLDELPEDLGGDLLIDVGLVGGDRSRRVTREITPRRRGLRNLGPTFLLWRSRLGLIRLRHTALAGGKIAILPRVATPERQRALSHRVLFHELGIRPRPIRGAGGEFASLREYVVGDDPRWIDWRASARKSRPIVRQYQIERRHTLLVAVDTGRLMAARIETDTKLDYAIECAIALARLSYEFGDSVGFIAFDRELRAVVRPSRGRRAMATLVEATLALNPRPFEPSYQLLGETLLRDQSKRALVIVITDFVEGGASRELGAWLAALARRHCVMLVTMRDRLLDELDRRSPTISRNALYRRLALQDLAVERDAALMHIRRCGVQTVDLDPEHITAPVLNRYIAIRQAGMI